MKTKSLFIVCFIILHSAFILSAFAQGTAFTYQGRLVSGTSAASGNYDLTFSLFTVSSGPGQVGSTQTSPATGQIWLRTDL